MSDEVKIDCNKTSVRVNDESGKAAKASETFRDYLKLFMDTSIIHENKIRNSCEKTWDYQQEKIDQLKTQNKELIEAFKKPHDWQIKQLKYEMAIEFKKEIDSLRNQNLDLINENGKLSDEVELYKKTLTSLRKSSDRLYNKAVDRLQKAETDKELIQGHFETVKKAYLEKIESLQKAEKVIEFYGNEDHWSKQYLRGGVLGHQIKQELHKDGGKRARNYLKENK